MKKTFFPRKRLFKDEGDKTNGLTSPPKDASILKERVSQITATMILPPWLLSGRSLNLRAQTWQTGALLIELTGEGKGGGR